MRSVLILCLVLAGCGVPALPEYDAGATMQDAASGSEDGGAVPDAGAPLELDAGAADQGPPECNPGVHTSACMNPASCIGTDHVCRPCC